MSNRIGFSVPEDYSDRYELMSRYDKAVVKNLRPMIGDNGDNETAAQYVNGAAQRRRDLFGAEIAGNDVNLAARNLLGRAIASNTPWPPEQQPARGDTGGSGGGGIMSRVKEAAGVLSDLVGVAVDNVKDSNTLNKSDITGLASMVSGGLKGVSVRTPMGTVENGRMRETTDRDRADARSQSQMTGLDRMEVKEADLITGKTRTYRPYETQQDAEGGDASGGDPQEAPEDVNGEQPVGNPADNGGGPRIAVNPNVFGDKRDALCVAMNEAYRVIMEMNGFEPQAEPTPAQRRFFADTAYANDEVQLRRTILARICTFDTSVQ